MNRKCIYAIGEEFWCLPTQAGEEIACADSAKAECQFRTTSQRKWRAIDCVPYSDKLTPSHEHAKMSMTVPTLSLLFVELC